ncbi:MAG: methionine synthase [Candidatus Omnitrophota bacterium]
MNFKPFLSASIIGSVPYRAAVEAVDFVVAHFDTIPCWPQLPRKSYYENMYVQFAERLPGIVIEEDKKRIFVNTNDRFEEQLEIFYSKYLAGDIEYFLVSETYAAGLYEFKKRLLTSALSTPYVKGQLVGPVSFALTVTDEKRQALYYNEQALDAVIKLLSLKAKWQIRFLRGLSKEIIMFLDEPYLASVGSAYIAIEKNKLISNLNEVIDSIHQEGALAGIHCCGNTDWSIITSTRVDIVSFDSYNYADTLLLYPEDLRVFIERGGVLAWGIVPTDENVLRESKDSLSKNIQNYFTRCAQKGISMDLITNQSMITPSCGTGTLQKELSERILLLACELSHFLQRNYR